MESRREIHGLAEGIEINAKVMLGSRWSATRRSRWNWSCASWARARPSKICSTPIPI